MTLSDAVLTLHDVARLIEQQVGHGQLSQDVRDCADRLCQLTKPIEIESHEGMDHQ